jgi:aerobic-type carbon monoxide dehydrogenase small subunit (CoxS/CutS family)
MNWLLQLAGVSPKTDAIRFTLNGQLVALDNQAQRPLLWALRADLALTGTKYGCGEGVCGACTVLVDGRPVRSCRSTLKAVAGKSVTTVEGMAKGDQLHPLQQAFIDHGAFQCGYCTPGMLLQAQALLAENPKPTRAQIAARMEHNLCRCGAHQRIVDAIEAVALSGGAPA